MAEPKYWAQPSQPGFGARLGQALAGGLQGLQQGLAWRLAERQQKEKIEREKMQQEFVNKLKEAKEKREIWEHKEEIKKAEWAKEDREYLETVVRPYKEEQQKYNLELNRRVLAGEITPQQASLDAQRFARAADIRVQTKIKELKLKEMEIGLEELETPGRGGFGFETPRGVQTIRTPPTAIEEPRYTKPEAKTKIQELIAEMKNPNTSSERRDQIADRIQVINERLGKEKYSDDEMLNWHQRTVIGR